MTAENKPRPGLGVSLRALLAHGLALFATRGELASLELAEARDRLIAWLLLGALAALLLLAALTTLPLWLALLFWDGPRVLAVGLLALLYLLGGVALFAYLRRQIATAPATLAQTREELRKDREALAACLRDMHDAPGRP